MSEPGAKTNWEETQCDWALFRGVFVKAFRFRFMGSSWQAMRSAIRSQRVRCNLVVRRDIYGPDPQVGTVGDTYSYAEYWTAMRQLMLSPTLTAQREG